MEIGKRKHLISIRSVTETNVNGEITPVETEIGTAWASIRPLSGREYFAAEQFTANVTHLIEFPYDSGLADLDAKHLIYFGSKVYDLQSVQKVEERNFKFMIYAIERDQ